MVGIHIEPIYQTALNQVQQHLEEICCHARQSSHHHSEDEQHLSLGKSLGDIEKPTVDSLAIVRFYVI